MTTRAEHLDALTELHERVFGRTAGHEPDVYKMDHDDLTALCRRSRLAIEALSAAEKPLLGLATTRELLAELAARAETGGYADYRTAQDDLTEAEIAELKAMAQPRENYDISAPTDLTILKKLDNAFKNNR